MKQTLSQNNYIVSAYLNRRKMIHALIKEGYLGMPGMCLSILCIKKSGTSVKTNFSLHSILSPPPIRPMVEIYPMIEIPAVNQHVQN